MKKKLPEWIQDEVGLRDLAGAGETGYGKSILHAAAVRKAELEKMMLGGSLKANPEKVKDTTEHIIGEMTALDWLIARPDAAATLLKKVESREA